MSAPPPPKTPPTASLWKASFHRLFIGLNTSVALLLMVALWGMANYLASRHPLRVDVSRHQFYTLSEKTENLLEALDQRIHVMLFLPEEHPLYDEVDNLINEYAQQSTKVQVERVDPNRDLARTGQLATAFGVQKENVVVLSVGDRHTVVEVEDMATYSDDPLPPGAAKRLEVFRGEQLLTSAIQKITSPDRPVVYFLTGHGEKDIENFERKPQAYSEMAQLLESDSLLVRKLDLGGRNGLPEDMNVLIIAGPTRRISQPELNMIRHYLEHQGRLLVMVDALVETGLEPLLQEWGVALGDNIIFDPSKTMSGRDVHISHYADHPITRSLKGISSIFISPRSVDAVEPVQDPEAEGKGPEDRPRFVHLASCSPHGWGEVDLQITPAVYEDGRDIKGPVCLAAAVEKGPTASVDLAVDPTRLVVIGDSYFASNWLHSGGSMNLLLNSVNWLLDRNDLIAIAPKPVEEIRINLARDDLDSLFVACVGGLPGGVAILGLLVWWRRRS